MLKFRKGDIRRVAREIADVSELFGDEVDCVAFHLSELSLTANRYGCAIEGVVPDCWGGKVAVCALPDVTRHEWVF